MISLFVLFFMMIRHLPGEVHLLYLGSLQKKKTRCKVCMRESVTCELISLLLFLVTSGATNNCVSISVKIVKLPIKNKVSD